MFRPRNQEFLPLLLFSFDMVAAVGDVGECFINVYDYNWSWHLSPPFPGQFTRLRSQSACLGLNVVEYQLGMSKGAQPMR